MKILVFACAGLLGLCTFGQGTAAASPDGDRLSDEGVSRRTASYHESRDEGDAQHHRRRDRILIQECGVPTLYVTDEPPHPHHHHSHGRVVMPLPERMF